MYCGGVAISFFAGAQDIISRVYTSKDGLPSNYVFGAYQDKLGYMWVGTTSGLSRFDGKHFTNYGLSEGLPDIKVIAGFMDSHLRFWTATSRGVAQLKGKRFINYPLSDSLNIRWANQIIETKKGQIWSLTNVGIYQFDANRWMKINLYPGYQNHVCNDIIETKEGLFINYSDQIVLRKQDGKYEVIGRLKSQGYYYNLFISAGEIFVATPDGLYKIINQQLVKLPGELGKLKGINYYYRDSKKRFWIGKYEKGIRLITAEDTAHFIPVYNRPADLLLQGISEDDKGNIWIGSNNGLIKISEAGFKIFDIPAVNGKNILRNVFQPPSGPLLFNNGSLSLQAFENGTFIEKALRHRGKGTLPNNELIIDNYAFDNKNRYWYQLRGFALVMQDGENIYEQRKLLSHLGNEVFDVLYDTYRKKILVAVRTQKFPCRFNDTSYSVLSVSNDIKVEGNIMHLHQCANGVVLFSTDAGHIYSINKQNICQLQLNEFATGGIISRFYNDPSGDLWIIYSGRGLRRYSWQGNSLIFKEQITKTNGLPTDNANALCFDDKNNLWVCNDDSYVSVFAKKTNSANRQTYQMISFYNPEDLHTEDAVETKMTKDQKGNIWLAARRNLICFYPDKINYKPPVPSIGIEDIELNLSQTNWKDYADSLSGIFQLPCNPRLSHENNTIGIYFKGISSSGTEGLQYSYLLSGLGNGWSKPSSNNFVSFVSLPPGKYSFQVKAQLPNTNWSKAAVFSFVIEKAFWQTWWFYLAEAMVLFTVIYLLFRYRLRQHVHLLEMRNQFSQDLHDEIGASVSGINLLSQMAAEKLLANKPGEASEYLSKVKNYSQDVIEKLSDMVWVFNPENDSVDKLLQRLKTFTISIALSKDIKIHFDTDKESEITNLSIRQRKAIYLISKEAINNIFKYAQCSNIYFSLHAKGSEWHLRIQDDGKGFTPSENSNGNGLKNMQARADEIGAVFNIQSQPAAGTIVTVVF